LKLNLKKLLGITIILVFISLNFQSICSSEILKMQDNEPDNTIKPPFSYDSKMSKIIGPYDEGAHNKSNLEDQEWWYFNGLIKSKDSELNNWAFMISFNKMRKFDIFFFTLYDDKNNSYGGNIPWWPGAIKAKEGPGINLSFNDTCNVTGKYPTWNLYIKDNELDEKNITLNLTYKANSKPHWIFLNTGRNNKDSLFGHYSILNCSIKGNITIDDTRYDITGVGYHEHHWFSFIPKIRNQTNKKDIESQLNVWDWYCLYLDNGWNLFIGNILQGSKIGAILPDILWLTPDGKNFSKCLYFKTDYLEMTSTSIDSLEIPKKIRVRAIFWNTIIKNPLKGLMYLDIYIENLNTCENVWGKPPNSGVWEGTCKIEGKIKWFSNTIDIKGSGIVELTRS